MDFGRGGLRVLSEHHYPRRVLTAAYARAGLGALMTGGPLALVAVDTAVGIVLAVLAALFLAYGAHTWLRHRTRIVFDDDVIRSVGPIGRSLPWRELSNLRLKYYSSRRDGRNGWHELDLRGRGGTIRIESTLEGFREVLARSVREAERRGLELNPTTRVNLRPFGLARERATSAGVER
jgi:hypothetical protein